MVETAATLEASLTVTPSSMHAVEALVGALGKALGVVTAENARGFFTHCGYRPL